jgi:hypothetical protein
LCVRCQSLISDTYYKRFIVVPCNLKLIAVHHIVIYEPRHCGQVGVEALVRAVIQEALSSTSTAGPLPRMTGRLYESPDEAGGAGPGYHHLYDIPYTLPSRLPADLF